MNRIATTELLRRRNRLGTPQGTYAWGNNDNYQLGINDPYYVSTIVEPDMPSIFTQVACGDGFFLALSETGDIYTWGNNTTGQLGHGDTISRSQPEKIVIDVTFKYIACGYTHAAAISTDGNLYLWGSNSYGQLSQNNTTVKYVPTLVGSAYTWASVACGEDFTIAINTNKEVCTCGYNYYGQLGTGNTTSVSYLNKIGVATNWEFVSCGRYHTLLINSAGELWCCGYNVYGQLGVGSTSTTITSLTKSTIGFPVTKAAGGHYHTVVIGQDGKAYGVGSNSQYQLGPSLPSTNNTEFIAIDANTDWVDVACNINATTIINNSNQVYVCGNNDNGELGTGNTLLLRELTKSWFLYSNWNKIACGPYDTAVINTSKKVWVNGSFYKEQSGNTGSNIPRKIEDINFTSIHAGYKTSFNITASAKLTQWGINSYKLGIPLDSEHIPRWFHGNTDSIIYPHYIRDYVYAYNGNIILLNKILDCRDTIGYCVYLDCNYEHAKTYPDIYCINSYGELFIIKNVTSSTFTIQKVESSQLWKFVACCNGSIFAISVDGELYSWGNNANGQLGLGDRDYRESPTKITHSFTWNKIVCGGMCWYSQSAISVYAIDSNGELYQWGRDFLGSNYSPVKVGTKSNWVDISCSLSTMNFNISANSSYEYHIAAIDSYGSLYTAGDNRRGQLGLGTIAPLVTELTRVGDSSNWKQVVCLAWLYCHSSYRFNGGRTIALNSDGELYVCGDKNQQWMSSNGRGSAYYDTSFIKLSGTYTNCSIYGGTDRAVVYSVLISDNYDGQTLPSNYSFYYGPQLGYQPNIIYATSSDSNSFIIKYPGELWGCGSNSYGQLGIGTTTSTPSFIKIGQAAYWTKVACGTYHTVVLNMLKEVWGASSAYVYHHGLLDGTYGTTLRKLNIPFNCLDIACCNNATIVLSEDGELYAGGANQYGQLGIGTTQTTTTTKIGLNNDWVRIECGDYHAAAINSSGELYVWGRNNKGQLGVGDNTNRLSPVRVDYYGTSDPILVKDVSCGSDFTILITTEGRMYATGNGNYGQLGAGEVASINYFIPVNEDTNWKSVSAGYDHVMATKTIRLE